MREVAVEIGRPPAQVVLAWVVNRSGVTSALIGASRVAQVADDIASLDIVLTPDQQRTLDEASAPPPLDLYAIFSPYVNKMVFGGATVTGWEG